MEKNLGQTALYNDASLAEMQKSLMALNGTTEKLQSDISTVIDLFKGTLAPKRTIDELVLQTQYFHFPSYGYPFNYLFISDSDSGATLTIGNKTQEHTITLVGGWNVINSVDGWWKCSKNMNVILLRSAKAISPDIETVTLSGFGATSTTPLFATLTGNTPPLDAVTPKLLATIPYTDFTTASASIYPYYAGVLTRSARARTFMIYNTMNEPLTSNALAFYDSVLGIVGQPGIAQTAVFTAAGSNAVSTVTSESASSSSQGLVASHVDSFQGVLGIGATLPTSGNVYIYGSELL